MSKEVTPPPVVSAQTPDFERSMQELETLVKRLEKGDLPLEEALKQFERGVALTRVCQSALRAAEQKVEILLKASSEANSGDPDSPESFRPVPFSTEP